MKLVEKYIKYTLILISLGIISCSTPKNVSFDRSGAVEFIEQEDPQTITLKTSAFGSNLAQASAYAERNAIENLLYKGIPGSNQRQAIIADEIDARSKHGKRLDDLVKNKYGEYLMSSEILYKQEAKDGVFVEKQVKFDLAALRKYLEKYEVIRSFGY